MLSVNSATWLKIMGILEAYFLQSTLGKKESGYFTTVKYSSY